MTQPFETCELCNAEKTATYVQLGVGVLGAALCPGCQEIAKTQAFKIELAHMLATGQGDLDKFVKRGRHIAVCQMCGDDLKTATWAESDRATNRKICIVCRKKQNKLAYHKKASELNENNKFIHGLVRDSPYGTANERSGAVLGSPDGNIRPSTVGQVARQGEGEQK